eukprot:m.361401 g.361401  ORF g.361401 m.361401 type:complete len:395 (-) comp19580_c0_seq1:209-1393(-)
MLLMKMTLLTATTTNASAHVKDTSTAAKATGRHLSLKKFGVNTAKATKDHETTHPVTPVTPTTPTTPTPIPRVAVACTRAEMQAFLGTYPALRSSVTQLRHLKARMRQIQLQLKKEKRQPKGKHAQSPHQRPKKITVSDTEHAAAITHNPSCATALLTSFQTHARMLTARIQGMCEILAFQSQAKRHTINQPPSSEAFPFKQPQTFFRLSSPVSHDTSNQSRPTNPKFHAQCAPSLFTAPTSVTGNSATGDSVKRSREVFESVLKDRVRLRSMKPKAIRLLCDGYEWTKDMYNTLMAERKRAKNQVAQRKHRSLKSAPEEGDEYQSAPRAPDEATDMDVSSDKDSNEAGSIAGAQLSKSKAEARTFVARDESETKPSVDEDDMQAVEAILQLCA